MARVIFWEKPGCQGNERQKEILLASGHDLEVRDLLAETWSVESLGLFSGYQRLADFSVTEVHNWIGLSLDSVGPRKPKNCHRVTVGSSALPRP